MFGWTRYIRNREMAAYDEGYIDGVRDGVIEGALTGRIQAMIDYNTRAATKPDVVIEEPPAWLDEPDEYDPVEAKSVLDAKIQSRLNDGLFKSVPMGDGSMNEADARRLPQAPARARVPQVDVSRPADVKSTTTTRSTTMTARTATVDTLVAALRAAVPANLRTNLEAVLKDAGAVATKEHHTVTITVQGETFNEVRDRAVRVISTYGPTVQQSVFPVTSDGVHFEHSVTHEAV